MFLRYLTAVCLLATSMTDGCPFDLCPPQSECVDGVCLCISGTFQQDGQCVPAQVFPVSLHLKATFQEGMEDRSSEIFRQTAQSISDAFFKALYGTPGYVRSDVVELKRESVIATVNNIYKDTDITQEEIRTEIQKEIEKAAESNELLDGAKFNFTDLCDVEPFPCDATTTTCSSTNGVPSCSCKEGYVPSPDSNTTCIRNPTVTASVNPWTGHTTTISPTTPAPVNTTIPEAPTQPPFIGCSANDCPSQSECVGEVCLCVSGTFLENDQCVPAAQTFPVSLHLNSTFQAGMEDRSSEIFRQTAKSISDTLFKALHGTPGYVRSDVVELKEGSVIATVNNIYEETDITEEQIQKEIEDEIKKAAESNELFNGATVNMEDVCKVVPFPCDVTTTTCSSTNGVPSCSCKENYVPSPDSNTTCILNSTTEPTTSTITETWTSASDATTSSSSFTTVTETTDEPQTSSPSSSTESGGTAYPSSAATTSGGTSQPDDITTSSTATSQISTDAPSSNTGSPETPTTGPTPSAITGTGTTAFDATPSSSSFTTVAVPTDEPQTSSASSSTASGDTTNPNSGATTSGGNPTLTASVNPWTGHSTTLSPTTPAPVNTAIPEAPTQPPFIEGCPATPCPSQSECVDGVCLCISGTFQQDDQCVAAAQVFPVSLHLTSTFQAGMENRSSEIFRQTAQSISDTLFKALFGTPGYVRSDVVELKEGSVIATVNNIYEETSITEEEIRTEIQEEIEKATESNELLNGATFNCIDLCEVVPFPCDVTTTTCSSTNGVVSCSCKEGYVPSPDSNTTCIVTDLCEVVPFPCDVTTTTCSSTNGVVSCSCKEGYVPSPDSNTTCIVTDLCEVVPFPCDVTTTTCSSTNGVVSCSCKEGYVPSPDSNTTCIVCPSGHKAEDNECIKCSFGYSGFNCNDSSLLVVVVVSCVLGGILLFMVLTLFIYCFGP